MRWTNPPRAMPSSRCSMILAAGAGLPDSSRSRPRAAAMDASTLPGVGARWNAGKRERIALERPASGGVIFSGLLLDRQVPQDGLVALGDRGRSPGAALVADDQAGLLVLRRPVQVLGSQD